MLLKGMRVLERWTLSLPLRVTRNLYVLLVLPEESGYVFQGVASEGDCL